MNRYKILLINTALGLVISLVWASSISEDAFSAKNIFATYALISLVAAPVDLVAGLVMLIAKKKETAIGFLLSAAAFVLIIAIVYFVSIIPS